MASAAWRGWLLCFLQPDSGMLRFELSDIEKNTSGGTEYSTETFEQKKWGSL